MPDARFLLLGDSHAIAIREAAIKHAVPISGGMLDAGKNLNIAFHRCEGSDIAFMNPKVDALYRSFLASLEIDCIAALRIPLVSTIGMNLVYLCHESFWENFSLTDRSGTRFLSHGALKETVRSMICGSLEFYRDVASMGIQTFSVLPPRGIPHSSRTWRSDLYPHIEEIVKQLIEETGINIIDHRYLSLDDTGVLKAEFHHSNMDDNVHGSVEFGKLILDEFKDQTTETI